ncbi:unnamed protein product [Closterium sp. NIES-53]
MVSKPTCASLACSRSGVDFVAETIARRATTSVDFAEQGRRSHPVAIFLQLRAIIFHLASREQVRLNAQNVEHVGDEHLLPGVALSGNGAIAANVLQRPIEAAHVLDVATRLQVDEGLLRPHQVVRAAAVKQTTAGFACTPAATALKFSPASGASEMVSSTTQTSEHDASLSSCPLPLAEESTSFAEVDDLFDFFSLRDLLSQRGRPPADLPQPPLVSSSSESLRSGHSKER